jgi:hypothetical protein
LQRLQRGKSRNHILDDGLYERDRQRITLDVKQSALQFGATPAYSDYFVFKDHGRLPDRKLPLHSKGSSST